MEIYEAIKILAMEIFDNGSCNDIENCYCLLPRFATSAYIGQEYPEYHEVIINSFSKEGFKVGHYLRYLEDQNII